MSQAQPLLRCSHRQASATMRCANFSCSSGSLRTRIARACPAVRSLPPCVGPASAGPAAAACSRCGVRLLDPGGEFLLSIRSPPATAGRRRPLPTGSTASGAGSPATRRGADGRPRWRARWPESRPGRHLMRAPAALTNDQLIAGVRLAHHNGLKQPDFLDRFGQLGQRFSSKDCSGLPRIGRDLCDRYLGEVGAVWHRGGGPLVAALVLVKVGALEEFAESSTQATRTCRAHADRPRRAE